MVFIYAFLIGGLICAIGQLIQDLFKLTPGHITGIFVMLGTVLDFFNFYDKLIDFAEAGALLPITSFGHSLIHSSMEKAHEIGFLGLSKGMFFTTSDGIVWAIILSVIIGLLFKPKG